MKKCFIVCPIGSDGSETRKRSDTLLKHVITPVCKECGFDPKRIDLENTNGSINEDILKHLREDDLVIADLTENNPNAFYEMGYRAALNKPSIHLMTKDCPIPFDVSSIRSFSYDLTDLDSVEEIKTRLIQTIKSIDFDPQSANNNLSNSNSGMVNAQILQEIYKLQDSIAKLTISIEAKDSSAVSVLADKLANTNTKTPETVIIESVLPLLLEHPDKVQALMELSKQVPFKK